MVKASELKPGDVILTEVYSFLWKRKVSATALIISIHEVSGNYCAFAKSFDGVKERLVDLFLDGQKEFERSIPQ